MNNVNLIGHLTRDPELKEIGGGRTVCELRLAVDNPGRDGERGEPTYVDVSTFGKHAGACAVHLEKGRQIAVSGRLVFREWSARDGSKRSRHSVRGSVDFLGAKGSESSRRFDREEVELAI